MSLYPQMLSGKGDPSWTFNSEESLRGPPVLQTLLDSHQGQHASSFLDQCMTPGKPRTHVVCDLSTTEAKPARVSLEEGSQRGVTIARDHVEIFW